MIDEDRVEQRNDRTLLQNRGNAVAVPYTKARTAPDHPPDEKTDLFGTLERTCLIGLKNKRAS